MVPENQEMLQRQKDGARARAKGASLEEFPVAKAGTIPVAKEYSTEL